MESATVEEIIPYIYSWLKNVHLLKTAKELEVEYGKVRSYSTVNFCVNTLSGSLACDYLCKLRL